MILRVWKSSVMREIEVLGVLEKEEARSEAYGKLNTR